MKKIEVSEAALDTLQRMVEELQAERDAFEKDALRYRWLRDKAMGDEGRPFICILSDGYTGQLDGVASDDAIDRTMNG